MLVGMFVIVKELPLEDYGGDVERARQAAKGRVCRVVEPHEGTSTDGVTISSGEVLLDFARIKPWGIDHIGFYAHPDQLEPVEATEEMLLLYSPDLWQLIGPYGEAQDTGTFRKLVATFGTVD